MMSSQHRAGLLAAIFALFGLVAPPALAETRANFEAAKTPKGLSFYHREDTSTPFVAISFGVRDIFALTTPGKEAFNGFGSAFVMQGADGSGQTEFLERMKDLTASASVSFGPFSTQGNVRAPAATIEPAMALLASALKEARPTDRLLSRLKQRAAGGEAQAAVRAETIAERAALWFLLGEHPITRGFDPARFERVGLDDLAQWRKASLDRSRLRLAASGRISREEAARLIDEAFAELPPAADLPKLEWPPVQTSGGSIVVEHDTAQSAVLLVGLTSIGPAREVETAIVANAVLGGSNGRLWQGVRASLGSTYGASSSFMLVGPGKRLVVLRAAVANDQVNASMDALKRIYGKWREDGLTEPELRATTSRMVTDFRGALDDPTRANGLVIGMLLAGRPVKEIETYAQRVSSLERDAINRFIADKFPKPEELVSVVVTPRADGTGATCTIKLPAEATRCLRR